MRFASFGTAALAATLYLSSPARANDGPSLWDLLSPATLIERALQSGILAIRTQMDITYGDMVVSPVTGQVRISDVIFYPPVPWDTETFCTARIDRLTLRSAAIDETDRFRIIARASGVSVSRDCMDLSTRSMAAGIGLSGPISVPSVTVDVDYDVPSSGAFVHLRAVVNGLAAADLTADLDYVWFEEPDGYGDPVPVVYLNSAALSIENLGGWNAAQGFLPPPLRDPQTGGGALAQMLSEMLAQAGVSDPNWTATRDEITRTAAATWGAFLKDPRGLTLETAIEGDPVYVDFDAFEEKPEQAISVLKPMLRLRPATSIPDLLPAALVAQAIQDSSALADGDRRRLGLAFVRGEGVPRHVGLGRSLLVPLADKGDGEAALALAGVLDPSEDVLAYKLALIAAGTKTRGGVAMLDEIEARLGMVEAMKLQDEMVGKIEHPTEPLKSIGGIREQAVARATGEGQLRSYRVAALWAHLGAALGDAESALTLELMDERARLGGDATATAWRAASDDAAALALKAWSQMDLPARHSGR